MLNISTWPHSLIYLLCLCGPLPLMGQDVDTTIMFRALSISDQHLIGSEADTIPLSDLHTSMNSLSNILRREANVYFRDFGPGSSPTVSLSGSRSNEVALIWNGIKISNPMLGVTDYSLISPGSLTGLRLARPGNATIFGAGSSAGAIILEQGVDSGGAPVEIAGSWSSLQRFHLLGSLNHQKGSWKSKTSIEGMTGALNYRYTSLSGTRERLPHAHSRRANISHHSIFDLKPHQFLSFSLWGRDHFREIPPSLTEVRSEADQSDRFIRALVQYRHLQSRHKWHFKAYYGVQNQIYRNPLISLHANHIFRNLQARMDNQWQINHSLFLKYGARTSLFSSQSDNYQGRQQQNHWAVYSHLKYKLPRIPLEFTALLQPEWVTGLEPGSSPGWTMEAKIIYARQNRGQWSAFLNHNIVWPTLNDLNWTPGGNPDLRPEHNRMMGVSWKNNWPGAISHSFSYYYKWGKDWIQWFPTDLGFWRPFNALEGSTHGINLDLSKKWENDIELSGGYQFVHTTTWDGQTTSPQTIYSPRHMWSVQGRYSLADRWKFWALGEYTSTRYVTRDHSQSLDLYFLCHSGIGYHLKNQRWTLGIEVTNLFGVEYQGIANRPMPGRQIQLNSQIKF